MNRTFLFAKLHHARITHTELEYDGSCGIDAELLDAAGIKPNEQIHIYNMNNGKRITTYAIEAPRGSKMISLNGAAAHHANPKDRVIICAYAQLNEEEAKQFKPKVLRLNENNSIITTKTTQEEALPCS